MLGQLQLTEANWQGNIAHNGTGHSKLLVGRDACGGERYDRCGGAISERAPGKKVAKEGRTRKIGCATDLSYRGDKLNDHHEHQTLIF